LTLNLRPTQELPPPRHKHVRVTGADLDQRATLDRAQTRLVVAAFLFTALYVLLLGKLVWVVVLHPILPLPAQLAPIQAQQQPSAVPPPPQRADITDRNGVILAVSLPGAALYGNPQQVPDAQAAALALAGVLPGLDEATVAARLADKGTAQHPKQFVYLDRRLTPQEEIAVNGLGIPGVYFQTGDKRYYPGGDLAAQILGGVKVDGTGNAGVEEYFNQQLLAQPAPLALSIDAGVQAIVHDELAKAIAEFQSPGGCAVVMNAHTGEILAMASLPDYDVNDYGTADPNAQKDICVNGTYEPGSVFKLQTISMALDSGMIHYWDYFDTSHPLTVGRFKITDFEPVDYWMSVPQIIDVSSNIGASRIATILGPTIEQNWLAKQGFFDPVDVQLPGPPRPHFSAPRGHWGLAETMTVAFGAGIQESPLAIITGVLPLVNGGIHYQPTLLAVDPKNPPAGVRVMQQSTSDIMRKLMTSVVLNGTGKFAQVPGYLVGGKTGTAQVVSPGGGYLKHTNNASFMAAFPMEAPQYVIYVLVLQPKPDATTFGYTTGGYISAPVVARIISRIGPMLGIMPHDLADLAALNTQWTIPMPPQAPPGAPVLNQNHPLPPGANGFAYELMGAKPPPKGDSDAQE
jgi:cell division protein FtsI (penicillin-binding protein 3)